MGSKPDAAVRWRVCRTDELMPGQKIIVPVAGREIGVFNIGGVFHALANRCPHRGAPLCLGRIRPRVNGSAPGEVSFEKEEAVIRCPWHQWEFDLATGRALADPRLRVPTFRTVVEDGIVHVLAEARPPRPGLPVTPTG